MNAQKTYKIIVSNTRKFFKHAKMKKAVLGVSGGIDSALTLGILADAIGAKNVFALILPYEGISSAKNIEDARNYCSALKVKYEIIEISRIAGLLQALLPWEQGKIARANTISRLRMLLLYNYANSKNALVAGTGNLSELSVGYFTKFGDGACDFMPLADLTKTKVIALAKHKKLPKEILKKAPSAELWPGQTDEAELNITYKALDQMIEGVISGNFVQKQLLNNPRQSSKKLKWLHARFFATQHKRSMPTIISAHALM